MEEADDIGGELAPVAVGRALLGELRRKLVWIPSAGPIGKLEEPLVR